MGEKKYIKELAAPHDCVGNLRRSKKAADGFYLHVYTLYSLACGS